MIAIDFGNLCFNVEASEQTILVVAAPKHTFSSLDDFITAALKFLESDEYTVPFIFNTTTSHISGQQLCMSGIVILVSHVRLLFENATEFLPRHYCVLFPMLIIHSSEG